MTLSKVKPVFLLAKIASKTRISSLSKYSLKLNKKSNVILSVRISKSMQEALDINASNLLLKTIARFDPIKKKVCLAL